MKVQGKPTGRMVAIAIDVATREAGCDPEWIRAAHVRIYVALALYATFAIKQEDAALLAGVSPKSAHNHLAVYQNRIKEGGVKWFKYATLDIVKAAIRDSVAKKDMVERIMPPVPKKTQAERELAMATARAHRKRRLTMMCLGMPAPVNNGLSAILGDPPFERSALAQAKPWLPYEQTDACQEARRANEGHHKRT